MPLQGLATEKLGLILETAPLQGLAAEKLRVVLEMAPLQGLVAEKWEMTAFVMSSGRRESRHLFRDISIPSLSRYDNWDGLNQYDNRERVQSI